MAGLLVFSVQEQNALAARNRCFRGEKVWELKRDKGVGWFTLRRNLDKIGNKEEEKHASVLVSCRVLVEEAVLVGVRLIRAVGSSLGQLSCSRGR